MDETVVSLDYLKGILVAAVFDIIAGCADREVSSYLDAIYSAVIHLLQHYQQSIATMQP